MSDQIWIYSEQNEANKFIETLYSECDLCFFSSLNSMGILFESVTPQLAVIDYDCCNSEEKQMLQKGEFFGIDRPHIVMIVRDEDESFLVMSQKLSIDGVLRRPFKESFLVSQCRTLLEKGNREVPREVLEHLNLTPKERNIFNLFLSRKNRSLHRKEIMQKVWGTTAVGEKTVDVHISHLRKKIKQQKMGIVGLRNNKFKLTFEKEEMH